MNDWTLIRKNLFRKGLRTTLLLVSIMIAFLIYGVLAGFNDSFTRNAESGPANRMIVSNKINFTVSLPYSHVDQVARVEGVTATSHSTWFGGYYQEPRNTLIMFAIDPTTYLPMYQDRIVLPDEEKAAFVEDRAGLLVGRSVADRFGWEVGQQVPLFSNIYSNKSGSKTWDFTVRGIYDGARPEDATSQLYFHYEYFRETVTFGQNEVGQVALLTRSADENDAVAQRIDAAFANSRAQTLTQDESAFSRGFIEQFVNLAQLITLVCGAAFAAILLIVGNTMVNAVRERTREIGVLKTLGFSSPRILRHVLIESVSLALLGAGIGLSLAAGALALLTAGAGEFFGGLSLSWTVALTGLALAAMLGLAVGLLPALWALRLRIIDALATR